LITVWAPLFEWLPGGDRPATVRPQNDVVIRPQNELAMRCLAAGRTVEAILLLERTLADCERVLGAGHQKTKAARKDLAALTAGLGG
jgi:hypothetical protein